MLCRILLGVCKNKLLQDFLVADRDAVLDALKNLPAGASKQSAYDKLTVLETIAEGKRRSAPILHARTLEKYLDRLHVCFQWAVNRSYLAWNPFTKVRLMTKEMRQRQKKLSFSEDDLKRIFDPALRKKACTDKPFKFWAKLIGLYGMMRANEIAQLHLNDVFKLEGTWIFRVDDTHDDQHLKNQESRRAVPVHQKLIELGFLDYLEDVKRAGFDRLFPELPLTRTIMGTL